MKFIKLDLLTLLISLFLFASCESTSTIGLEVDPTIAVQGTLVDSITITSRTLQDDVISTTSATRHPLGFFKDPIFGTTEASLAMSVSLPSEAYDFGTTPVLDSAILVLNYGGQFYGDSTSTYSIDVHQLSLDISRESSFLSSRSWPFKPSLLGNKTGKIYPSTSYKVTDVVAGKADTLRSVTPQLRIPIDKTFVQNTIVGASSTNLKFFGNFTRYFGGLHVQINKANSTGNGGLMFLDFAGANSELVLYYKNNNTTSGLRDTLMAKFPIVSTSGPVASTITQTYTTEINNQLANPTTQYPVTYLQPLSGLKNKIAFPYLSKFATNVGKMAVNKAELVIDLANGTNILPYNAAPRLSLYRYDIAEKRQNLPDNATNQDPRALDPTVFGGYFNFLTNQYVFVVTSYIQDLLDGKTKDYGTFLAPTPSTEFDISPSISTGARSVIGSFKKNPTATDKVMKLNIYYTKIN